MYWVFVYKQETYWTKNKMYILIRGFIIKELKGELINEYICFTFKRNGE